jgi:hypothetical protein
MREQTKILKCSLLNFKNYEVHHNNFFLVIQNNLSLELFKNCWIKLNSKQFLMSNIQIL